MKEAAGEANLTVVAIILIAVVVAVATPLVTSLMRNSGRRACCSDAGGVWKNGQCNAVNDDGSLGGTIDYWDSANGRCTVGDTTASS